MGVEQFLAAAEALGEVGPLGAGDDFQGHGLAVGRSLAAPGVGHGQRPGLDAAALHRRGDRILARVPLLAHEDVVEAVTPAGEVGIGHLVQPEAGARGEELQARVDIGGHGHADPQIALRGHVELEHLQRAAVLEHHVGAHALGRRLRQRDRGQREHTVLGVRSVGGDAVHTDPGVRGQRVGRVVDDEVVDGLVLDLTVLGATAKGRRFTEVGVAERVERDLAARRVHTAHAAHTPGHADPPRGVHAQLVAMGADLDLVGDGGRDDAVAHPGEGGLVVVDDQFHAGVDLQGAFGQHGIGRDARDDGFTFAVVGHLQADARVVARVPLVAHQRERQFDVGLHRHTLLGAAVVARVLAVVAVVVGRQLLARDQRGRGDLGEVTLAQVAHADLQHAAVESAVEQQMGRRHDRVLGAGGQHAERDLAGGLGVGEDVVAEGLAVLGAPADQRGVRRGAVGHGEGLVRGRGAVLGDDGGRLAHVQVELGVQHRGVGARRVGPPGPGRDDAQPPHTRLDLLTLVVAGDAPGRIARFERDHGRQTQHHRARRITQVQAVVAGESGRGRGAVDPEFLTVQQQQVRFQAQPGGVIPVHVGRRAQHQGLLHTARAQVEALGQGVVAPVAAVGGLARVGIERGAGEGRFTAAGPRRGEDVHRRAGGIQRLHLGGPPAHGRPGGLDQRGAGGVVQTHGQVGTLGDQAAVRGYEARVVVLPVAGRVQVVARRLGDDGHGAALAHGIDPGEGVAPVNQFGIAAPARGRRGQRDGRRRVQRERARGRGRSVQRRGNGGVDRVGRDHVRGRRDARLPERGQGLGRQRQYDAEQQRRDEQHVAGALPDAVGQIEHGRVRHGHSCQ